MFGDLRETYSGKKVFLTGHTGFKGAWLLKILTLLGAEVKGYSLAPDDDRNIYTIIKGDKICESIIDDLRNKEKLKSAVREFKPDFVFHLAAQPLVRLSYEIPSETFEVNAIGTANLLDAIKLLDNPCYCVFITTDKVYHNNEWTRPYSENDMLGGYDPYSASKACAELIINSYRNSFFNLDNWNSHNKAIAVGRAGNVIGGGDWAKDRLIPDIARALSGKKTIVVRNPESIRPWQHVLEPLFGYLILGHKLAGFPKRYSQAYNFGPNADDVLSVKEMVELALEDWGEGAYQVTQSENAHHEAGLLRLDISKAQRELDWKPKLTAREAVERTIDWYKVFFEDTGKAPVYTERQILDFMTD